MKFTIYKELHSKCDISSLGLYSDGDCDATLCAWTQCPHQPNKKSFCLKETWATKPHFLSCLRFISVFTSLVLLSACSSMSGLHSPWLLHCHLDWLELHFLEKFNSCTGLPTYALSKRLFFFQKLFCFVFHFSPMFKDCQSLNWKKSKEAKTSLKIIKQANTNSFLFSGHKVFPYYGTLRILMGFGFFYPFHPLGKEITFSENGKENKFTFTRRQLHKLLWKCHITDIYSSTHLRKKTPYLFTASISMTANESSN